MKRVLPVLVLSLLVFALTPIFSASAAPTVVVRPGHLAGWVPRSNGVKSYGRWDTGPETAPLGSGSLLVRSGTRDSLEMQLPSPVPLAAFTASFHVYGGGYVSFYVRAPNGARAALSAGGSTTWRTIHAMSASDWQWDCNGAKGNGTIQAFLSACAVSTVEAFGFAAATGPAWVDAAKLGPSGNVKLFNFEPPTVKISDAQMVEGNSGTKQMPFVVRLSGRNQDKMWVEYGTSGHTTVFGRACSCEDFAFAISVLKIPAGHARGVIDIGIFGDTTKEPTERFSVRLMQHSNCVPTDALGVGTIVNDD